MVLEEDPNPENASNVITTTRVGHMKKECRIWKKEHNGVKKEIKRLIQLLLKVIL